MVHKQEKTEAKKTVKFIQAGHNWVHNSEFLSERIVEKNFGHRFQIVLIRSGCVIKINNQPMNNFPKNTLFIVQSGTTLTYGSDGNENFVNDWIELSATPEEIQKFGLSPDIIVPEITPDYTNLLSETIRILSSENYDNDFLYECATNAHLQIFLVDLAQYVNNSNTKFVSTNYQHPYYTKFLKIRNRIFTSRDTPSISELALELSMSESHFRRCYKEIFRTPVHQDLILHKIELSQQLLKDHNNYTVGQVADILGYNNYEHFIRQFKKVTHITPLEYRKTFYQSINKNSEET